MTKVSLSRRYFAATSRATPPEVAFGSKLAFPAAYRQHPTQPGGSPEGVRGGLYLQERSDTMMITSTKSLEIIMCLHSSRIIDLRIPHGSSIFRDPPIHNIISNIPTHKKPLVCNDSISRKCRSLEQIQESTGMQCRLSVMDTYFGVFGGYAGEESRS